MKLQCTPDGLTKFSVEIVQQLEFTTSAANSQPQQISTNVTVKTHANASVKSDVVSPPKSPVNQQQQQQQQQQAQQQQAQQQSQQHQDLLSSVKQEPDSDFVDLEECAAAVEKDVNVGANFGSFSDLIGEDAGGEIMTMAAFKKLFFDVANYGEFMTDFDFGDKSDSGGGVNGVKVEDLKDLGQAVDGVKENATHTVSVT